MLHDMPIAYLPSDIREPLQRFGESWAEYHPPPVDEAVVKINASLHGPLKAQLDLKFGETFSGLHIHQGYAIAFNYLLPTSTGSSLWVFYSHRDAKARMGKDAAIQVLIHGDLQPVLDAGVRVWSARQHPGSLVVLDPDCVHMVLYGGEHAAHLAYFADLGYRVHVEGVRGRFRLPRLARCLCFSTTESSAGSASSMKTLRWTFGRSGSGSVGSLSRRALWTRTCFAKHVAQS